MEASVVTLKGQVVIPKKIRSMFHIKRGTQVRFEPRNGEIVLKPLTPEYFEKMAGILGSGGKVTKALLEERVKDRERENR
jgi:AbrB family looped-hinge helix DNA binding protein